MSRLYPKAREHAWIVRGGEAVGPLVRGGEVVELTAAWNAPTWYWGIKIPAELIRLFVDTHSSAGHIRAYRALVTVEEGDSEEGDTMIRLLEEANPESGGPFPCRESVSEEESE